MQKFTLLICSLGTLAVFGIGLSSCKDDEPFVKPNLSVSTETISVNENAGTAQVEFVLDGGAPENLTIEYSLGGTAISPADYTIVGTEGEVEIASGQTSAVVQIQIVNDAVYEGDETIEISIEDVSSVNVVVTNDDETEVTITDDDTQIKVSFPSSTLSLNEADPVLDVQVVLDKAATSDILVDYQLSGSARDSVTAVAANPDLSIDYSIVGTTPGKLTIKAGQTSGIIRVRPRTDALLEDGNNDTEPFEPESIIITIVNASNGVNFATNNTLEIALQQQDGVLIILAWAAPTGTPPQQADMDMFLRGGANITTWDRIIIGSASETFEAPEFLFLPKNLGYAAYGLSYTYYEGTLDPLEFEVGFIDFVNGALEGEATAQVFTATYSAANKNMWTDPATTQVVQTFKKVNNEFAEFSPIAVPASGSRVGVRSADPKSFSKLIRKIKNVNAHQRDF